MNHVSAVAAPQLSRRVPPRPPRDLRLDIVRGWLQLSIFASHATGSFIGAWLIHGRWGLSDSSEQFVFLSGLMLGSLYSRNAARDGWAAAVRDMLRRTLRLYRTHLVVFVLTAALVALATATILPGEAALRDWTPVFDDPLGRLPGILLMVQQPNFMGILPLFVWCMLLLPGFAALEARFGTVAMALSAALYLGTWGVLLLHPAALGWEAGIGFDPLTWQVLFLGGAFLGRRLLWHGQAVPLGPRWRRALTALALLVVTAGLVARLGWPAAALPAWLAGKKDLALPILAHALSLAWLVARFVPRERAWMHGVLPSALAAIGRHSLMVFCLGLFLSWGATVIYRHAPPVPLLDPAVIGVGCVVLALQARWLESRRQAAAPSVPSSVPAS